MDEHLGYGNYERSEDRDPRDNYRNGTKGKNIRSSYGEFQVDVPQARNSTFEPQVVKKHQKDISEIDQKIISMYAKGLTTRQISEQIEEIYGFECSESFISDVFDDAIDGTGEFSLFIKDAQISKMIAVLIAFQRMLYVLGDCTVHIFIGAFRCGKG